MFVTLTEAMPNNDDNSHIFYLFIYFYLFIGGAIWWVIIHGNSNYAGLTNKKIEQQIILVFFHCGLFVVFFIALAHLQRRLFWCVRTWPCRSMVWTFSMTKSVLLHGRTFQKSRLSKVKSGVSRRGINIFVH